jgi:hypothetical protein
MRIDKTGQNIPINVNQRVFDNISDMTFRQRDFSREDLAVVNIVNLTRVSGSLIFILCPVYDAKCDAKNKEVICSSKNSFPGQLERSGIQLGTVTLVQAEETPSFAVWKRLTQEK